MKYFLPLLLLVVPLSGCRTAQSARVWPDMPCEEAKAQQDPITLKLLQVNEWVGLASSINPFFSDDSHESEDIYLYHDSAYTALDSLLQLPAITRYNLECLLGSVDVSNSEDRCLWLFQWYENTGGSFHSNVALWHGRDPQGRIVSPKKAGRDEAEFGGQVGSRIAQQFDTLGQRYYLAEEGARTCNTCIWEGISVYQVSDSGEVKHVQTVGKDARRGNVDLRYDHSIRAIT